jgi:hypothetical protein
MSYVWRVHGNERPTGYAVRNRSASCQVSSLGYYGALNLRGSVTAAAAL